MRCPSRRVTIAVGISVVLLLVTAAVMALFRPGEVKKGHALADTAGLTWGFGKVPPGQEVILMLSDLQNISDAPVTIRNIRALETDDPSPNAEIVRFYLAPAERVRGVVAEGPFLVFPPGESHPGTDPEGECTLAEIVDPEGYVLSARQGTGEGALLVTWYRALAEGKGRVKAASVTYEQEGQLYEQKIPVTAEFRVDKKAQPLKPTRERGCFDEAQPLPPRGPSPTDV
ncbi:MAG: hypothetical protein KY391_03220 [Actinobacteria bacterium]|nr:hypothetical protein [Actinomycetota bacterium]